MDVRDVALAHFNAGYLPEANGRNIISGTNTGFIEMGKILTQEFGDKYPFPKKALPKFMAWLLGPLQGISRKFVSRNLGYEWKADNSKSIKDLNMNYRPLNETLRDFFQQMLDVGMIKMR